MRHVLRVVAMMTFISLLGCASPQPRKAPGADAAPDEAAAVLAAVDRTLLAMEARDKTAYAQSMTPDGMTYSQRLIDGQWRLRARTNQQDVDTINDETDVMQETYWEPTVLIRGPIAVVWAPYEFRINGEISHCGVDAFEMLKIDGRWVMGNAMWTVEPDACDDLRPPADAVLRPARSK
jgi:hypothetical protein